jgi:hypothetical protein
MWYRYRYLIRIQSFQRGLVPDTKQRILYQQHRFWLHESLLTWQVSVICNSDFMLKVKVKWEQFTTAFAPAYWPHQREELWCTSGCWPLWRWRYRFSLVCVFLILGNLNKLLSMLNFGSRLKAVVPVINNCVDWKQYRYR